MLMMTASSIALKRYERIRNRPEVSIKHLTDCDRQHADYEQHHDRHQQL
jgi:hypothetical protein